MQYPPNWTKKLTPQGRPYYCNMLTNETTWNIEDVDPTTGELVSSRLDSACIFGLYEANTFDLFRS